MIFAIIKAIATLDANDDAADGNAESTVTTLAVVRGASTQTLLAPKSAQTSPLVRQRPLDEQAQPSEPGMASHAALAVAVAVATHDLTLRRRNSQPTLSV